MRVKLLVVLLGAAVASGLVLPMSGGVAAEPEDTCRFSVNNSYIGEAPLEYIGDNDHECVWEADWTSVANIFEGNGGSDNLIGKKNDDHLYGGTGDDHLYGGPGADFLWGGSGPDRLMEGGPANNSDGLDGENGDDVVFCGNGEDLCYGGENTGDNDWVYHCHDGNPDETDFFEVHIHVSEGNCN